MSVTGKIFHFGVDVVLLSTCLAGIKRNTGLTPKIDYFPEGPVQEYVQKYLNMGESMYDYSVATLGSSSYFQRK